MRQFLESHRIAREVAVHMPVGRVEHDPVATNTDILLLWRHMFHSRELLEQRGYNFRVGLQQLLSPAIAGAARMAAVSRVAFMPLYMISPIDLSIDDIDYFCHGPEAY
jgi:hypothetical protein